MFGLISAGISLAGLGMSAVQALKSGKAMKDAKNESKSILQNARNRKEQNAFSSVQAADVSSYQEGKINQNLSQAVDTLSQTGAEGAIGGVTNALQAANDANLQATQAQGEANFQRDVMKAEAQQGINERQTERDLYLDAAEYEQSNQAYNDASAAKASAIENMLGSAVSAVGFAKEDFDPATGMYKYKKTRNGSGVNKDSFSSVYGAPKPNYNGSVSGNYGTPVNTEGLSGGYNWGLK